MARKFDTGAENHNLEFVSAFEASLCPLMVKMSVLNERGFKQADTTSETS